MQLCPTSLFAENYSAQAGAVTFLRVGDKVTYTFPRDLKVVTHTSCGGAPALANFSVLKKSRSKTKQSTLALDSQSIGVDVELFRFGCNADGGYALTAVPASVKFN